MKNLKKTIALLLLILLVLPSAALASEGRLLKKGLASAGK